MSSPKLDPESAVRDMFGDESQSSSSPQREKVDKNIPAPQSRPAHCELTSKFLTVYEVAVRYRVSKATVWRWVANDPLFPAPIKLSAGTSRWREEQLRQFEYLAAERSENKANRSTGAHGGKMGKAPSK